MSKKQGIEEFDIDTRNANRGTDRGRAIVRQSLEEYGAGRSVLADKNGTIIAGNQTLREARAAGLDVEVVQSDGTKLIVHQRVDLELDKDDKARALATIDNAASAAGLEWDGRRIGEDLREGHLPDWVFDPAELDEILTEEEESRAQRIADRLDGRTNDAARPRFFKPVVAVTGVEIIEKALDATGENARGAAILTICQHYLDTKRA